MSASLTAGSPRHILAVTALVRNASQDILMIDSPLRGWELPGGQVEEGETLVAALIREVQEETGIIIHVERLAVVHSNLSSPSKVIFGFLGRDAGGVPTTSAESNAVEWVPSPRVVERIAHAPVARRTSDLLSATGGIRYLAYTVDPYTICSTAELAPTLGRSASSLLREPQ